jgi:hypothetical protein
MPCDDGGKLRIAEYRNGSIYLVFIRDYNKRLFQNFSFWNSFLEFSGKTGPDFSPI